MRASGQVLQTAAAVPGTAIAADAEIVSRARTAAAADLAGFKRSPGWPLHPIALGLSFKGHPHGRVLNIEDLLRVPETRRELCIVSPPGTGKTTMLLQSADALLVAADEIAIFVPLNEWSTGNLDILDSILGRLAFSTFRLEHLQLLAQAGRLALLLDGWNELDSASRRRATIELRKLRRELPLLRIIVSTRQQATDVPISGPTVGVQPLSWAQQSEIARGIAADAGVTLLDKARRTSGVRELVSIPLYLTVLLKVPGGKMPTTKEELLRLFVAEHERSSDNADALRDYFQGCHKDVLVALGVETTVTGTAALSEGHARTVVSLAGDRLIAAGQIAEKPSPIVLLDALVSRHILVRSGSGEQATLSLQHQQFQEWYASFQVQDLMIAASTGDRQAADRLRIYVLDLPSWEESILFACERMSRAGEYTVDAVATTIIGALSIDPMLAAEMIYRSSADVWEKVKGDVIAFVNRWHTKGMVDRAVRFMIITGKSEFASLIWPLIASADDQIHIATLRAADRFRPGVLGKDARERLMALPDEVRETVLGEIAVNSGIEGMELAADVARADTSPKVQFSVFQGLQFRRSDRLVKDVLRAANPAVWSFLVERGYAGEMTDPDIAARLRAEMQSAIETDTDLLRRLRLLLHSDGQPAEIGSRIEALIASEDFPFREQNAYPNVYEAFKSHPREVTSALRQRLEAGLEIPFGSEKLLVDAPLVDDGPIVSVAIDPQRPQGLGCTAARIIGPNSVATLIGAFLSTQQNLQASGGTRPLGEVEKLHNLGGRIRLTQQEGFIAAWLRLSETSDSERIAALCDLLAMHGRDTGDAGFPPIAETHRSKLVAACQRMAETLLASPTSSRHDFERIAQAIGRIASPELINVLGKLLAEDLKRWRASQEARSRQLVDMTIAGSSDAATSYTLQYARAFAAIGTDDAIELMKGYLTDPLFGYDAAVALKEIWDKQHEPPPNRPPFGGPEFSAVKARREERRRGFEQPSPIGEAVFAVVEERVKVGRSESDHRQTLGLAQIALSMPYADKAGLIAELLGRESSLHQIRTVCLAADSILVAVDDRPAITAPTASIRPTRPFAPAAI